MASLAEDRIALQLGYQEGTECFAVLARHLAALAPREDVDAGFHDDFIYAFSDCCKTLPAQLHHWLVKTEGNAIALSRRLFALL